MIILLIDGPAAGHWIQSNNPPLRILRIPIYNPSGELFVPKQGVETALKPGFPYTEYYLSVVSIGAHREYVYLHSDLADKNPLEVLLRGYKP